MQTVSREIVNSMSSFTVLCGKLLAEFREHKYLRVTWTTRHDRSLSQNRLWGAMYERISKTLGDGSAIDAGNVRAEAKLLCGVPILRRDCERFEAGWQRYFARCSYKEVLFLMGANPLFGADGFPVTRLFDTRQGAEYTEALVKQYGPQGVFFDDLLEIKNEH